MAFARVVPLRRTPPGVEAFDYRIPDSMSCTPGTCVLVPFRSSLIPAVVIELLVTSPYAARAKDIAGIYADIVFPPSFVELLRFISERTFSSLPLVLSSWLRTLPKRPGAFPSHIKTTTDATIAARWSASPSRELIERAHELVAQGRRILLLTPWQTRVDVYARAFPKASTLDGRTNDGDAFRAWASWQASSSGLLIATRLGAWLSPLAEHVLLDEPENDDYKQDDMAPRYDARKMVFWASQHAHTSVESFGTTPSLHLSIETPVVPVDLTCIERRPKGGSPVPCIQSATLIALTEHEGPRVIIHAIRGVTSRLRCRECGFESTCERCGFGLRAETTLARCPHCAWSTPVPDTCTRCGGVDLGKSMPGIERVRAAWEKQMPDCAVEWRDTRNESMDAPFPHGALVVVTDPSLLGGVSEDVRRRERLVIAWRRLAARVADAQGSLLIQIPPQVSDGPDIVSSYASWLTPEGYAVYRTQELAERQAFHYPPTHRLVKCVVEGSEDRVRNWMSQAQKTIHAEWRGPYPVEFRSRSRTPRCIVHALFPPQTSESTLVHTLFSLKGTAWIDLDPIAFFH